MIVLIGNPSLVITSRIEIVTINWEINKEFQVLTAFTVIVPMLDIIFIICVNKKFKIKGKLIFYLKIRKKKTFLLNGIKLQLISF